MININRATEKELQSLYRIGPVRAKKIIANRPYRDIYELSKVRGLGKHTMDSIIPHITA